MHPRALVLALLAAAASLPIGGCTREAAPASAVVSSASPTPAVDATAPANATARLQRALEAIVADADGMIGVSAVHLRTGARASVHGDRRLPMMSVFKLPLAVVTLDAIDAGRWTMSTPVPLGKAELRPTNSPIAEAWQRGETAPSLETMLRLVVQASDNTAGDKLVTWNGGGATITARLRALGLRGIDVAEQELDLFARIACAGSAPPPGGWSVAAVDGCSEPTAEAQRAAAEREVEASPNGASADGLVDLLVALDRGTILSEPSRRWLHATMLGTTTGSKRLKRQLPEGTPVEHKTGTGETVGGVTVAVNDVGLVGLPNGDRFAIAVLVAGSHRGVDAAEATIARVGKACWDVLTSVP